MSSFRKYLQGYLCMRRGLGFKLRTHERYLRSFVRFLEQRGAKSVSHALTLEWASQSRQIQPVTSSIRLRTARTFAQYLQFKDPRTEVLPAERIASVRQRPVPYLYSHEEIERLLSAAKQLQPTRGLRPQTYHCLLGLLTVTGLRIGEALALRCEDVDLQQGVLTIRGAKFGKSRLVPLHPSTRDALARYARGRNAYLKGRAPCPYFLIGEHGRQLCRPTVYSVFCRLCWQTGLRRPGVYRGPRLHDFRHRYAVEVLLNGYRSGQNTELLMPVLSTFLGHSHVQDTYWYLSACPQLLQQAVERLQARWETYS